MRQMKESGIQWLGKVPEHWEISRLKSRIAKRFGGCWGEEPTPENMGNARLCVRIADFDFNTQTVKSSAATMRAYTYSQIYKTKLLDGDIIVEKSGGGEKTPVGRTIIFNSQQFDGSEVLFANFCECFRLKKVKSKFFAYLLKTFYQSNDMHLYFNQTTGLQNLDIEAVINSKAAFPSLDEQERIAAFLDKECSKIDSIYADVEKQIETLEQYKRSVITEAVTKGLNPNVVMKDSGISYVGEIPQHWEQHPVYYYFAEGKKSNAACKEENLLSLSFGKVIRKDINTNGGLLPASFSTYNIVNKDDIIIRPTDLQNDKRSLRTGLVKERGIITSAYIDLVPYKDVNSHYYHYLLHSYDIMKVFYNMGNGVRQGLNYSEFSKLIIITPSKDEQQEIVAYLDKKCAEIESVIADKKKQLEVLENFKKSLIYEHVTGKKEVVNE